MKNPVTLLLILCLPVLSSCTGFSPVYAENSRTRIGLSSVEMNRIDGRNGFNLGQEMLDRGGIQTGENGKYQLRVRLAPSRVASGVRVDNVATRFDVQMIANWQLLDSNGNQLKNMTATATASFDSPLSPYAAQVAEQDAEDRAVATLADVLLDQLGFYFAARSSEK